MTRPPKLLLTGSRGVVGSALVSYLKAHHPNVEIVHLDSFPFSLQHLHDAIKDQHVTYFVNCAAISSDALCTESPYECHEANVTGVVRQLEIIRRYAPHVRYLSFGSTHEQDRTSPYAATKREMREAISSYRSTYGLYAVVATLGFTESCRRSPTFLSRKITSGAAKIAKALKAGQSFEPLSLFRVDERFHWTWVDDVCDGVWRMLNQGERSNVNGTMVMKRVDHPLGVPRDFSLISPESASVKDFARLSFEAAGVQCQWFQDQEEVGDGQTLREIKVFGDTRVCDACLAYDETPANTVYDTGNAPVAQCPATTDLGWQPRVSFPELVKRMMACEMETTL